MENRRQINRETVKKVSEVARLHLEEDEIESMTKELERILDHFSKIKSLKADKELFYVHEIENEYREDKDTATDPERSEKIRGQFTKSQDRYLTAPKAIK